jgi:hypothetical protein
MVQIMQFGSKRRARVCFYRLAEARLLRPSAPFIFIFYQWNRVVVGPPPIAPSQNPVYG